MKYKFLIIAYLTICLTSSCSSGKKIKESEYQQEKIVKNKNERIRLYYEKGKLYRVSYFLNGKLDGKTLFFNENGGVLRQLNFIKGKLNGNVYFYSNEGEVIAIYEYTNDLFTGTILLMANPEGPPKGHGYYPLDKIVKNDFN